VGVLKSFIVNLKGKKMAISKTEKPSTTKTAAAKKPAPKKVVAKKAPAVKKATPKKPAVKKTKPSPEALYKMTEVAAYYIALNNGFAGNPSDYWIAAEAQISALHK
jgi:hypothetical protein